MRNGSPEGVVRSITRPGPEETGDVTIGVVADRPNDLTIGWMGGECDRVWRLDWPRRDEFLLWPLERGTTCRLVGILREIVVTLDHPVDLVAIGVWNGGASG